MIGWVSDMDVRTHLYRHFNSEGVLLYVGISLNTASRLYQHKKFSKWFDDISEVKIESFDSRAKALKAETKAIKKESPICNIQHNKTDHFDEIEKQPTESFEGNVLTKRVVHYRSLYTLIEAGKELGFSAGKVKSLIESGRLGCVVFGTRIYRGEERDVLMVTGFQIIDFIENLEVK